MNKFIKLIFIVLVINSIIVSQQRNEIANPFPKFIPYVVETDIVINNFNYMEINNLGKEQPARWLSIDRLADKYPGWTPYNYTLNNPLRYVDPNGDSVRVYTETSGVGHSWISTGEGDQITIYTFGRYAGTEEKWHGINSLSNGPGVLVKLEGKDALNYNKSKTEITDVSVFTVQDVNEEQVISSLNTKFNLSSETPTIGTYANDSRARVIGNYDVVKNNCVTFVVSELNSAGSNAMNSLVYSGTQYKTFVPQQLQTHLRFQAATEIQGNGSVTITGVPK